MVHNSICETSVSLSEVSLAPRTNQKNRTREALLAATRELMSEGKEVTLAKVAERARTSRATVYRYFSNPGVLALDATLDIEVTPTSELLEGIDDVRSRVHAVARYYLDFSRDHEAYFRQFLAESLKAALEDGTVKMRGARRLAAFAEALEPIRPAMRPSEFEALTQRLSMTSGMEQLIILEDILRVDQKTGNRLLEGLVDALLDKYLPGA
ncbi:TetR/AcrR family transcriptional regulator [Ruegeria sp. HKCCA5014]|uniref:TetR/AcrR family transcriptional regulator n=1 Tax=Ruegeria sp. HKCCA5014 TaxID=2682980 RepID=UPI002110BB3D|nr:TetR/AcrR family transcriptional regulator [Ruegeria sp. HKCCA5014]